MSEFEVWELFSQLRQNAYHNFADGQVMLLGGRPENAQRPTAKFLLNPQPQRLPLALELNLARHFGPPTYTI